MNFFRRQAEVFNNLAFNHLRVADNAAQVRVLVHVALGLHHIAMVAVGKQQAAFPAGQNARALLQPATVYAVSGAVQVAAGYTLMALHQIEGFALPELAGGVGKPTLAADPPPLARIADVDVPLGLHRPLPLAGDDVQFKIAVVEGFQRAGDKALRTAVRAILLAYQSQPEFTHASTFFAAAITASVGIKSR